MMTVHAFTLNNDIEELETLGSELEVFFEANEIDFETANAIQLSLDELITNIISYAYEDDEPHEIEVSLTMHREYVMILLKDDGKAFDPFERPDVDTKQSLEERQVGGLGIHLVKNMMDQYSYKRHGKHNLISLTKYFKTV